MAIYTTFFASGADELLNGFPGWRLPLPEPVRREVYNWITKKNVMIETREPEWPVDESPASPFPSYKAVAIQGNYEDYLEGRLPGFVHSKPHWAAKGLTDIEIEALGEACQVQDVLECALYSRPGSGGSLMQFRPELTAKLASADTRDLENISQAWAKVMSQPDYTHSMSGQRIMDDWKPDDAMRVLQRIVAIAKQAKETDRLYLLIEA